ncbi:MAG: hypothetical protein K2J72_09890, partial [Oscillospiraceae bacterium]|nr:hypothetical protein [Oscillospiraceae bacterium]
MFAPPRNGSRRFSPPAPFGRLCACGRRREFRRLRTATKGLRPLDFCQLCSAGPALVGGFAA